MAVGKAILTKTCQTTLVIGGCRSGKSRLALEAAGEFSARTRIFMATAQAYDEEMAQRIARHKAQRARDWKTVEVRLDLPEKLEAALDPDAVVVVDCLTLWVTSLLMDDISESGFRARINDLASVLEKAAGPAVLVTNEVGCSVVPENALARKFRDLAGEANQAAAAAVDRVILAMAGIPVVIKEL